MKSRIALTTLLSTAAAMALTAVVSSYAPTATAGAVMDYHRQQSQQHKANSTTVHCAGIESDGSVWVCRPAGGGNFASYPKKQWQKKDNHHLVKSGSALTSSAYACDAALYRNRRLVRKYHLRSGQRASIKLDLNGADQLWNNGHQSVHVEVSSFNRRRILTPEANHPLMFHRWVLLRPNRTEWASKKSNRYITGVSCD